MKNKLLFIWKRDFSPDIELVANNHKDLEEYLEENLNFSYLEIAETEVILLERDVDNIQYIPLVWVKEI
jgi:hypothetical protein